MPCRICRDSGHNARTCDLREVRDLSDQPDFVAVGRWFEDCDGTASRWFEDRDGDSNARRWFEEEDPDAEFDEFIKLIGPDLNFEAHMMKALLEEEVEREKRECIICYEAVGNEKVSIKCGHTYCVGCFVTHMRMSNQCAYCRTELCEVPQSKRKMTRDTRTNIVETALTSSNGWLRQTLLDDFTRQTREAVLQINSAKTNTRSVTEMNRTINEAIQSVDITFASYLIGIHTSNYISEWYES